MGDIGTICPHTGAGTDGLHLRVPRQGRTTTESRAPAGGGWQVIDGRSVSTREHRRTKAGGVTLKVDCRQTGAAHERPVPDASDAAGDRDAGEAGAGPEHCEPDACNAVAYR